MPHIFCPYQPSKRWSKSYGDAPPRHAVAERLCGTFVTGPEPAKFTSAMGGRAALYLYV